MIRGAYVGRLRPGRVSSRYDEQESGSPNGSKINLPTDGAIVSDTGDEAILDTPVVQSSQIQAPLVRIHSECYTGETAWSARCDCGEQLDEAARLMSEPSSSSHTYVPASSTSERSAGGVIIYLRQEGRGIGLGEKLKAYNLQDLGSDTVEANLLLRHPADARSYGLATAMLVDLGLGVDSANGGIRLLTNNPDKVLAVEGPNREVVVKERVPMIPLAWRTRGKRGITSPEIEGYLRTKVGYKSFSFVFRVFRANHLPSLTDSENGPYDRIVCRVCSFCPVRGLVPLFHLFPVPQGPFGLVHTIYVALSLAS